MPALKKRKKTSTPVDLYRRMNPAAFPYIQDLDEDSKGVAIGLALRKYQTQAMHNC